MIYFESTPTGKPTPTSPQSTTESPSVTPTATPTASTASPSSAPSDTQGGQLGDDGSAVGTLALFAGVIGVALGWALREVTAFFKGKAEAGRQKESAEQSRVLEFIHAAEDLSAAANGIATVYAAMADGTPFDRSQVLDLTSRYNEARIQLSRLRLEIAILGPEWVGDLAMNVENAANVLQTALRIAEQKKARPAFAALISEINMFKDERGTLIKAATGKYQPGRVAPVALQAEGPPTPQLDP